MCIKEKLELLLWTWLQQSEQHANLMFDPRSAASELWRIKNNYFVQDSQEKWKQHLKFLCEIRRKYLQRVEFATTTIFFVSFKR